MPKAVEMGLGRWWRTALVVGATAFVALPASADPIPKKLEAAPTKEDKKGGKDNKPMTFPMPAADFEAQIEERVNKAKEKLEKVTAKMDASTAAAVRKQFNLAIEAMNKQVKKATADGTVTAVEARRVQEALNSGGRPQR